MLKTSFIKPDDRVDNQDQGPEQIILQPPPATGIINPLAFLPVFNRTQRPPLGLDASVVAEAEDQLLKNRKK